MAAVVEIRAVGNLFERVEAAALRILFKIIVGIHDVDEFAEVEAHVAQRLLPLILVDGEELRHDIAEVSRDEINVIGICRLRLVELVQTVLDDGGLVAVVDAGLPAAAVKELGEQQLVEFVFIVPVVQAGVIGQNQIHVRRVFGIAVDAGGMLAQRMRDAACLPDGVLRIIEITENHDQKSHVIAECHLTGKTVFSFQLAAESAVVGAVESDLADLQFLFIDDHITKHNNLLYQEYNPFSGAFFEFSAALGAADHDFTLSLRNADLLTALRTLINMIARVLAALL